jgi:endogenous inhibitor of DNA gyrase (YacG/DUF329 family)
MVGLRTPDALCVYCRKRRIDPAWQPFCSERCKMADLGRWLGEEYRVPAETPASPDADEDEQ